MKKRELLCFVIFLSLFFNFIFLRAQAQEKEIYFFLSARNISRSDYLFQEKIFAFPNEEIEFRILLIAKNGDFKNLILTLELPQEIKMLKETLKMNEENLKDDLEKGILIKDFLKGEKKEIRFRA
ncbi:MAG: hypothetical protein ACPLZH_01305, partial [Minisyncoccales bacterium]